jgi:hypothetical protein
MPEERDKERPVASPLLVRALQMVAAVGYENYRDTKTTGMRKLPGYELKSQRFKLEERTHKFRQENLAV